MFPLDACDHAKRPPWCNMLNLLANALADDSILANFTALGRATDGRQSNLPVVLPHLKMLPKVSKHFLSILISPTA